VPNNYIHEDMNEAKSKFELTLNAYTTVQYSLRYEKMSDSALQIVFIKATLR